MICQKVKVFLSQKVKVACNPICGPIVPIIANERKRNASILVGELSHATLGKIPLFQDCVHCANAAQDVKIYQTGASHEQLHIVQMNAAQDVKLYIPPHSQKKK